MRQKEREFKPGIILAFMVCLILVPANLGLNKNGKTAVPPSGRSGQVSLLGTNLLPSGPVQAVEPVKTAQSTAVKFHVQAFMDDALTQPLKSGMAKCPAGRSFYLKVIATKEDGSIAADTYFNTPGKTNVTGSIIAFNTTTNEQYGKQDFPSLSTDNFMDISPGVAKAKAVFNDTGVIRLAFSNSLGKPVVSEDVGRFFPDHLVVSSNEGTPVLTIRGSVGSSYAQLADEQRQWGYIGEPMILQFTVQAEAADGQITENYNGQVEPTPAGWGLSATGNSGRDYTSRLRLSGNSTFNHGVSQFNGTLTLGEDAGLKGQELIQDFKVTVCPQDMDGATIEKTVGARVVGKNGFMPGPYNLYTGIIHVVGGYFNEAKVDVPVQLEIWDGRNYVVNTLDSQTRVELVEAPSPGQLPILSISGNEVAFTEGKGNIALSLGVGKLSGMQTGEFVTHLASQTSYLRTTGVLAWSSTLR